MNPLAIRAGRAALAIAQPGHELLVHGWLELARPSVFVLADGSGRHGRSRLDSTTKILSQIGAAPSCIYGRLTELAVYAAILNRDFDLFISLAEELSEALVNGRIEYVVGDAAEGQVVEHDVWRLVIDAAILIAQQSRGLRIANFDFVVAGRPDTCPEGLRAGAICLHLDDDAFARKLEATRNYPEIADEIEAKLKEVGVKAFSVEWLRPVHTRAGFEHEVEEPPFYERHGEKLVAAGHFERAIRYREHVVPLAQALWRHAERRG